MSDIRHEIAVIIASDTGRRMADRPVAEQLHLEALAEKVIRRVSSHDREQSARAWEEGHIKGLGAFKPQRNPYRGDQS